MRIAECITAVLALCGWAQAGVLAGKVLDLDSDRTVAGVAIRVSPFPSGSRVSAGTGRDGQFRIEVPGSGSYRLEFSKAGYASSTLIVPAKGGAEDALMVRMARFGALHGKVTTVSGDPVLGASVVTIPVGTGLPSAPAHTDDRGEFDLPRLVPGEHMLAVSHSGAGTTAGATAVVTAGCDSPSRTLRVLSGEEHPDLAITLPGGEARDIAGRVTGLPPGGRALLTLVLRQQPAIPVATSVANAEGQFRFQGIHPGTYEVLAIGPTDLRLNAGHGGLLAGSPFFGRSEVELTVQDVDSVSIAMQPGLSAAFRVSPVAEESPCTPGGSLKLDALEQWTAPVGAAAPVGPEPALTVGSLAPGRYRVGVSGLPEGCFYLGEPVLDLRSSVQDAIPLRLGRGARVSGRVRSADKADARYVVLLAPEVYDPQDSFLWILSSDDQGGFEAAWLRPGTYRMLVVPEAEWLKPGFKAPAAEWSPLQLAPGKTDLDMTPPAGPD